MSARRAEHRRPYAPRLQAGRVRSSQGTADEIRAAALELFATRGYQATTVDDIADRVGIRGPSLYRHFRSKQDLLRELMLGPMDRLLVDQQAAIASTSDVPEQLRRAVHAHVRFHTRHQHEAFVGNREIHALAEPSQSQLLDRRDRYEHTIRGLIETGVERGLFHVPSARLASYAIVDMGIGVATWFRPDGPLSMDEVTQRYGDFAMSLVGAGTVTDVEAGPQARGDAAETVDSLANER